LRDKSVESERKKEIRNKMSEISTLFDEEAKKFTEKILHGYTETKTKYRNFFYKYFIDYVIIQCNQKLGSSETSMKGDSETSMKGDSKTSMKGDSKTSMKGDSETSMKGYYKGDKIISMHPSYKVFNAELFKIEKTKKFDNMEEIRKHDQTVSSDKITFVGYFLNESLIEKLKEELKDIIDVKNELHLTIAFNSDNNKKKEKLFEKWYRTTEDLLPKEIKFSIKNILYIKDKLAVMHIETDDEVKKLFKDQNVQPHITLYAKGEEGYKPVDSSKLIMEYEKRDGKSKSIRKRKSKNIRKRKSKSVRKRKSKNIRKRKSKSVRKRKSKSVRRRKSKSVRRRKSKSVGRRK
jgi:hypothetical protein